MVNIWIKIKIHMSFSICDKAFPLVFRWINLLITETVGRKSNILHLTTVMTPVVPPRPQAMPHSSWWVSTLPSHPHSLTPSHSTWLPEGWIYVKYAKFQIYTFLYPKIKKELERYTITQVIYKEWENLERWFPDSILAGCWT